MARIQQHSSGVGRRRGSRKKPVVQLHVKEMKQQLEKVLVSYGQPTRSLRDPQPRRKP